jgi:hypothetical protein
MTIENRHTRIAALLMGMMLVGTAGLRADKGRDPYADGRPRALYACAIPPPRASVASPRPTSDFMVGVNANYQWVINGVVNPTLTLTRGQTYSIDLTAITDEHPFVINSDAVYPFAPFLVPSSYGQVITFTPDLVMPSVIHYHCTVHYGVMSGVIQLVPPPPCTGDLNADQSVNVIDYGIFVNAFGAACAPCPSDLNADGTVNSTDYGLFVNAFGTVCN